jgi:tRNA dimethylallyltransferase
MKTKPLINKYLIVVVGPTAVGKTDLCLQLAQRLQTEIISADARQLYQGMAIGAAQPSKQQLDLIPHHFINHAPITAAYSAGIFEKEAGELIAKLFVKHQALILTGGSGLYVQAVCEGFSEMPAVANEIRSELNERLQQQGLAVLAQELAELDPDYYQQVDSHNPQRVVRALEVIRATGKPYSQLRITNAAATKPFQIIKIGLQLERAVLYQRINQRVDQMMEQGLLEEATALYPYRDYNSLQTVGYSELFQYLDKSCTIEEAVALIKRNTRRYAKRQLTWFRQQQGMTWFHPQDISAILQHALTTMESK